MSELMEKTIGSAGAVCVFGLFVIWTIDLQFHYKIIATSVVALLVFVISGLILRKRRQLHKKRQEQLRSHRMDGSQN